MVEESSYSESLNSMALCLVPLGWYTIPRRRRRPPPPPGGGGGGGGGGLGAGPGGPGAQGQVAKNPGGQNRYHLNTTLRGTPPSLHGYRDPLRASHF